MLWIFLISTDFCAFHQQKDEDKSEENKEGALCPQTRVGQRLSYTHTNQERVLRSQPRR